MKRLAIIALSLATAFSAAAPASAFPSVSAPVQAAPKAPAAEVQTVQYWRHRGWGRDRHDNWGGRHWRGGPRYSHRYYRHRHGNAGAVIGGLALGAIVGGAIASQPRYAPAPRYARAGSAHTQWCYNRYRSYRAYDNTFQPYNGPRQQCYSPY